MRTWHNQPGNLGGMEYLERKYLGAEKCGGNIFFGDDELVYLKA